MKTFMKWFEERSSEKLPHGCINGEWFAEHGLPMIVECECCGTTMVLPSAMIDEEGYTYCSSCVEEDE